MSREKAPTTNLDIEQHPHVFEPGLCEIFEQIRKTRHWLVRFFQRPQLTDKLIVTVEDLFISAKASLEIFVLYSISGQCCRGTAWELT